MRIDFGACPLLETAENDVIDSCRMESLAVRSLPNGSKPPSIEPTWRRLRLH